jgi:Flp pilus assembly protein TadD
VDSLGWVLFRRGQIEEARRELERASRLPDGDDPVIWDHLGDVYERLRMTSQAKAAWEKAVHLYEHEHRRNLDDRYREVRRKLEAVTAGTK